MIVAAPRRFRGYAHVMMKALTLGASVLSLIPLLLGAQSTRPARISGTVFDSTLSAPLGQATVDVVDANDPLRLWTTTTDAKGEFTFDALPPGRYAVAVSHPRLDSLGIRQLSRGVALRAGDRERVRLGVPSAPTLIGQVCGDSIVGQRLGYVRGVLRDADRAPLAVSGTVRLHWLELSITEGGIGRQIASVEARADDSGRFTACGVPAEGVLQLRAWSGGDSTGVLELSVPYNGILLRDLYVGRGRTATVAWRDSVPLTTPESAADTAAVEVRVRRGDGTLRGTTRTGEGTAVSDVRVSVWGTGLGVRTTAEGQFFLNDLPLGSHTVDVRAIGYLPTRQIVDVLPGDSGRIEFNLDRMARLDTIRIMATREQILERRLAEFELNRKTRGLGRFIPPEALERHPPLRVADMFRTIPGLRVVPAAGGDAVVMRGQSFGQWCAPELWIDGVRTVTNMGLDVLVNAQDVLAAEVYNSGAAVPAQLAGFTGCGAIVLHTGMRERARR